VDRFALLADILNAMQYWRVHLGSKEFYTIWQDNLAFKNELVKIEQIEKPSIIGSVKGIDTQGNLLLSLEDGSELAVEVGDVHLRSAIDDKKLTEAT